MLKLLVLAALVCAPLLANATSAWEHNQEQAKSDAEEIGACQAVFERAQVVTATTYSLMKQSKMQPTPEILHEMAESIRTMQNNSKVFDAFLDVTIAKQAGEVMIGNGKLHEWRDASKKHWAEYFVNEDKKTSFATKLSWGYAFQFKKANRLCVAWYKDVMSWQDA